MNPFFVRQMAMYSAYHRNARNRATHFVGIPMIAIALFVPMAWVEFGTLADQPVTLALVFWATVSIFYVWLDRTIGLAMTVVGLAFLLVAAEIARHGSTVGWAAFAALFVVGWVFQLVGHVFEGRRPALVDNLLQALIGPMFLVAEVVFAMGYSRDLHEAVESRWVDFAATTSPSSPVQA
jgi:uncharacterized membrane protein YGL010W